MDIFQMENNSKEIEYDLESSSLLDVEADSFYVFCLLLDRTNRKHLKDLLSINFLIQIFEDLIKSCAPKLYSHFQENGVELFHFCFRWIFCFLVREFPFFLSIKLMAFYFTYTGNPQEMCLYFCMTLLLMFQSQILKLDRDKTIIFLQKLPTDLWGYDDISNMHSEAMSLRNIVRPIMIESSAKYSEYLNIS